MPETLLSGQTKDISPFIEHEWYNFLKWCDQGSSFLEPKEVHGQWIGPSMDIGPAMCPKIIKSNGQIINLSSYRGITEDEIQDPTQKTLRDEFDSELIKKLGQPISEQPLHSIYPASVTPEHDLYSDKDDGPQDHVPNVDDLVVTPDTQDKYVGAKVNLSFGWVMRFGSVKRQARDAKGVLFGNRNSNPILETRSYEVEFPDGDVAEFTANVIAKKMFSQCDDARNQYRLISRIVDH